MKKYFEEQARSREGNYTVTNPSKNWMIDKEGVITDVETQNIDFNFHLKEDYFLVTYIVNKGQTGEKREQKVLLQSEVNNLTNYGYVIVLVQKVY